MRSPTLWNSIAGIQSRTESRVLLMGTYLLLVITCYTTTKAVRDSLFISEVGTRQLPYLYMLIACFMALISSFYPGLLRRKGLFGLVRATSLVGIASLLVFWSFIPWQGNTSIYILYVWVSLFGAITASQAWSLASHIFDAREARRSFGWIGLGGIVGGIVGGTLAQYIAPLWGTESLLALCALLMGITILILHRLARPEDWEAPRGEPAEAAAMAGSPGLTVVSAIKESPYISMMIALLVAGVIVEAFIDFEFKAISVESFDSKDNLTSFFGTIASYGGVLALLFQTLVTNRLLKRLGVGVAILLLPCALLASFLVVAAWPALWAISLLKLLDTCLSYSVHRSGMELLYVPIPERMRASVKALIDMFVDRAGRAAGGLLLIALTAGLSFSVQSLSLVAAGFLVAWLAAALIVRRNYVDAFRGALEKKVVEPETLEIRTLDSTIVNSLINSLSSRDDRRVLYALDLLGRIHPSRWQRRVPTLLQHKSAAVRAQTIALLTQWHVAAPSLVSPRVHDTELDVRAEAIRHLCAVPAQDNAKLKQFLFDEDYRVVLAAVHCMAKYKFGDPRMIDARLIENALKTTGEDELIAKTAAARGLAIAELPETTRFLDRLLKDPDESVVQQAIKTAGEIGHVEAIPLLISMLARPRLRRVAREALLQFGPAAESALRTRLQDPQAPVEMRARIPKVLSYSATQEMADFLLSCVHSSSPRLDMPLLKALNRIRERSPEVSFNEERVVELIDTECEKHARLRLIYRAIQLENAEGENPRENPRVREVLTLLSKALGEKLSEGLERVFRLLALIYPQTDIHAAFFSITARPALRASALEFLDNLIAPPLRARVMPLVEEDGARDLEAREVLRGDVLRILLADNDDWIQTIAKELTMRLGVKEILSPEAA
jgi:ATP:ADP antiporter, AAA family